MHFFSAVSASLLLASSVAAKVIVVKVSDAGGDLKYIPNDIVAAKGDQVQFQFYPKNHTVTQSTFANPCVPINNINASINGFFSGFMPVSVGGSKPVYTITINDTKPIWFYCSQGKHCQAGMVGAINANETSPKNLTAFTALAAQAPVNLFPGEQSPASASGGSTATGSSGSSSTGASNPYGGGYGGSSPTTTSGSKASGTGISTSTNSNSATSFKVDTYLGLAGVLAAMFAL